MPRRDPSRTRAMAEQVTIELVRHSVAEEVLVYPQVEAKVSRDADDPGFDDELGALMAENATTSPTRRGRCSRTCARSSTATSCAGSAAASRRSRRSRRPGRILTCPTSRFPAWRRGRGASLLDRTRDLATGRGTDD